MKTFSLIIRPPRVLWAVPFQKAPVSGEGQPLAGLGQAGWRSEEATCESRVSHTLYIDLYFPVFLFLPFPVDKPQRVGWGIPVPFTSSERGDNWC